MNVFDTHLGCRQPTPSDYSFLQNFLTLVMTPAGAKNPYPATDSMVIKVIRKAYEFYSDGPDSSPKRYNFGTDAMVDKKLKEYNIKLGKVIDPSAVVSPTATLCDGVIVTSDCIIASSAYVGENVIINVKSIVGHDIILSNDVVVSSMVNIGGACKIGAGTYLGMGCLIKEGLEIGEEVIIGMGSAVHHNIPNRMIALGNPARPMKENIEKKVFK